MRIYNDDDINNAIKEVAEKYGKKFTKRQYVKYAKENELPSVPTIRNRRGSFSEVKKEILGMGSLNRKQFSEKALKDTFEKVIEKYGLNFTQKNYIEFTLDTHHPSVTTIRDKYGSFNVAKKKLLGKNSVNHWGSTTNVNYKVFKNVDNRILEKRIKHYKKLNLNYYEMLKNVKNLEIDREFGEFCYDCTEIKGCHQNKKRCPYWEVD